MASYRLLSYADAAGKIRPGLLVEGSVVDLQSELSSHPEADFSATSVHALLDDWDKASPVLEAIGANPDGATAKPLAEVTLRQPITRPGTIYCAASNYFDHSKEMQGKDLDKSSVEPYFFVKSTSVCIGPGEEVRLPMKYSEKYDWEAEITAVVGRAARNLTLDNALECLAGYTILNDLSARDRGRRDDWPFKSDWFGQKCFDTSGPMGPWVTPADEIADPQNLAIKTTISGEVKQDSSSTNMVFSLAEQIVSLTAQLTLKPGDLIATGTCAGVGAATQRFLKPGDHIHMEIEGLGVLENPVVAGD